MIEDGLTKSTTEGVLQGGPLSPMLSNVYLDKLDTLSPKLLGLKTKDRPGLVDPLAYYFARCA